MRVLYTLFTPIFILFCFSCNKTDQVVEAGNQPNILWITSEDMTPMLGCYGDIVAKTPNLDRLAGKGTLYTNAFATAPVCSPSRSCLVTGVYATSLGTQNLRSEYDIPDFIIPFPKMLREKGYYCSNNYKEDYNFEDPTIWDESSKNAHWRNKKEGQPFLSVFNFETTHQSRIFGSEEDFKKRFADYLGKIERHDPMDINLPPYSFDSPEIRRLWARYYDVVSIMDIQVGEILQQLKEDGLDDNTIIFYYADHGTGMPRGKRALYDSGLKVPLIIMAPEKYHKLLNLDSGMKTDRLVSFVDFAPTLLNILEIPIPGYMQGKPFLGAGTDKENDYVYGTSDRVDEAYEMARTVRSKKFRYVRNYLPHLPLIQPNFYSDQSEILVENYRILSDHPEMTDAQKSMWTSKRQPEELYDLESDPFEVNNLAGNPAYRDVLLEMRKAHLNWEQETFDTGFMPETYSLQNLDDKTAYEIARNPDILPLDSILSLAELHGQSPDDQMSMKEFLSSTHSLVRYWALTNMLYADMPCLTCLMEVQKIMMEDVPVNKLAAAELMLKYRRDETAQEVVVESLQSDDQALALMAARVFELNKSRMPEVTEQVREIHKDICACAGDRFKGYDVYACWALNEAFK